MRIKSISHTHPHTQVLFGFLWFVLLLPPRQVFKRRSFPVSTSARRGPDGSSFLGVWIGWGYFLCVDIYFICSSHPISSVFLYIPNWSRTSFEIIFEHRQSANYPQISVELLWKANKNYHNKHLSICQMLCAFCMCVRECVGYWANEMKENKSFENEIGQKFSEQCFNAIIFICGTTTERM